MFDQMTEQTSNIVFSAALAPEVKPLVKLLSIDQIISPGPFTIYVGRYGSQPVIVLQTGSGSEGAILAHDYLISNFQVSHIIVFGFAGAVLAGLKPGDILIPNKAALNNRGGVVALDSIYPIETWSGDVYNGGTTLQVDRLYDAEDKSRIENPDVVMVDMESYGIASLAKEHGIPVSVIRVIADDRGFNFHTGDKLIEKNGPFKGASLSSVARFKKLAVGAAKVNADYLHSLIKTDSAFGSGVILGRGV